MSKKIPFGDIAANKEPRVLVHVHIFYPEIWVALREVLGNLVNVSWDLEVTVVADHPQLREDIVAFKPDAHIRIVENRGWDIFPFLDTLNRVSLDDYDYVVKLHTKRNYPMTKFINGFSMRGAHWRNYLLEFLRTKQNFQACLDAFAKNECLGMVADFRLIRDEVQEEDFFREACKSLLARAGLPHKPFCFVPGTIFMARAHLFEPLKNFAADFVEFSETKRSEQRGLPHQMERFLGALVYAQNYTIADVWTPPWQQSIRRILAQLTSRISYFLYQDAVTGSGHYLVKICKIPVWRKRQRRETANNQF